MLEGVVVGGWEFIIPAYVITAVALAAYTWSVLFRRRRLEKKDRDDD